MKTAYIDCTDYGHAIIQAHSLLERTPGMILNVGDPDGPALDALLDGTSAIINGHTIMDSGLLRRSSALKTIVFLGTGASSYIDMRACEQHGIEVITMQGYGDRTNAEHAFAMMLSASRNIAHMDRGIRQGAWATRIGIELQGKRLGVIGAGRIGRELIRIASAFGMEVVAWNRSPIPGDVPCEQVALDELLASADVISLHLALNETTRGMLSRERLSMLKPGVILINTARGALLDEIALVDALKSGRIHHAALDVFVQEPLPPDHPFTRLDNVTLTAHAAFSSRQAMLRLLSQGIDAMARIIEAGAPS